MVRKLATELDHKARNAIRLFTRLGLGALAVFYVVAVFVNRELGLVEKIERPLILTALLLIITILVRIEQRLPEDGAAEVVVFADRTSFYEATRKAVENARKRVYVTYFRSKSPVELDAAVQQHFRACRKWANGSAERSFRRVMINTSNPSMVDYLRQELSEVLRAQENKKHYNVKLLDNVPHDVGAISLGIYDDDQVFISYVSGRDRVVGVGIRSREVVRECFEHYYDHLWTVATAIEESSVAAGLR
ncbi:hypothetical protein [Saccharothrix variisporea]|uniref:Uncharacterized protein n=1 Tax=Saccharothrix variisporea TaxID=543527 RepID=A0A495X979_9PSEU|nr:hypothetical protein [Saccharothrix variisporea]RKT71031.1 hypothetical protein DFJ66_4308 [Saccharothrix variisporea]